MAVGEVRIAQQADVGAQRGAHAVPRHGRQVVDLLQRAVERLVFARKAAVFAYHLGARVDVGHAGVAVHDDGVALLDDVGVFHAHDGRNLERLGQNGGVRGGAAVRQDHTLEMFVIHAAQVGQRQIVGDQNQVLASGLGLLLQAEQVAQDALADVQHVGHAVAQVFAARPFQAGDVVFGDSLEGTVRGAALTNARLDLFEKRRVLQHHAVHVEDRPVDFRQPGVNLFLQRVDFADGAFDRGAQMREFRRGVVGVPLLHGVEAHDRMDEMGAARADAGRPADARQPQPTRPARGLALLFAPAFVRAAVLQRGQHPGAIVLAFALLGLERFLNTGLHDDVGDLRRDRLQQPHLGPRKPPPAAALHDHHPEQAAGVRHRQPEKRMETLLAGLGKVFVAFVGHGVWHHDRLAGLDHQPGETFVLVHADLADGCAVEAGRGPQREAFLPGVEQVEGAHVGAHPLGDDAGTFLQGVPQVLRAREQRVEILKQLRVGRLFGGRFRPDRRRRLPLCRSDFRGGLHEIGLVSYARCLGTTSQTRRNAPS